MIHDETRGRRAWMRMVMAALSGWLFAGTPATVRAEPTPLGAVSGAVSARPAKYRRNTVVYLTRASVKATPPEQPVTLDQRGMQFRPSVLPIVRGTTVRFTNSDRVRHNVFSPDHDKYDLGTWGRGISRTHTFDEVGVYEQLCRLHTEMQAFVVVLDTPYFAVTDRSGRFSIRGVPPGTYTLHVWSATRSAAARSVEVDGDAQTTVDIELTR